MNLHQHVILGGVHPGPEESREGGMNGVEGSLAISPDPSTPQNYAIAPFCSAQDDVLK
ncbi:MAG TPA: hypothetical protein VFD13_04405 [Candidatus Kapabacteria bacterium]|nr:hypothetical protein [Candidatus Kapabacteria bacterium]